MSRTRGFAWGLIASVALTTIAGAQELDGVDPATLFTQLDGDGNGVIEPAEVPESGRPAFEKLVEEADTGKDGRIDRKEYRAMIQGLRAKLGETPRPAGNVFEQLDKNGDQKISRSEFLDASNLIERLDLDKDGSVSREEAKKRPLYAINPNRFDKADKDGNGSLDREDLARLEVFLGAIFKRLDANGDGSVDRGELTTSQARPGAVAARFKTLDKDGDQKLSRDEFNGNAAAFKRADADGDGSLPLGEFQAVRPGLNAARPKAAAKAVRQQAAKKKEQAKTKETEKPSAPTPDGADPT